MTFSIVTKSGESIPFETKILSDKDKTFENSDTDAVDYGFYFHPPIKNVKQYTLHVAFNGIAIFSTLLYPTPKPLETLHLLDRFYVVFETLQLCQSEDETLTYSAYVQFNNNGKIEPAVDMTLHYLPQKFGARFKRIPYFPYDVDPTKYGIKVDTRKVAQRTPMWFKIRGDVSGSICPKFVGFWVPTKEEDPNWSIDAKVVFSARAKASMRMGRFSEENAFMLMLLNTEHIVVELVGWCDAPKPFPHGWGASPDGLLHDPTMTWDRVPDSIKQHLDCAAFDPSRGALEIKSSTKSLDMEAYFYPQVYMEMIATETCWCDLVRYRKTTEQRQGKWIQHHHARIYRIFRHGPTEETLVALFKRSAANKSKLQSIIQEGAYCQMRDYLKKLATLAPYREISGTGDIFTEYEAYKQKCITISPPPLKRHRSDDLHEQIKATPTAELILEQMEYYISLFRGNHH